MWSFSGSVAVFCNDQFIGGLEDLLQWAAQRYNYQDFRCAPVTLVCNTALWGADSILCVALPCGGLPPSCV